MVERFPPFSLGRWYAYSDRGIQARCVASPDEVPLGLTRFSEFETVPLPSRTLTFEHLRQDFDARVFPVNASTRERFGMEVEVFPFRAGPNGPEPVPLFGPEGSSDGIIPWVEEFARSVGPGIQVVCPGETPGREGPEFVGRFTFEPGGQVEFSCAPHMTPGEAYTTTARLLDGLEAALLQHGVHALSFGANPWHGHDIVPLATDAARYVCMDRFFASVGPFGQHMMRRTGAAHVNLDFGGPNKAGRRWKAAQLLAPIALATFANSPFENGALTGHKSLRGRSWRKLEPTRTGFPSAFLEHPDGRGVEQYLEFALDARVMAVRHADRWVPQLLPVTFRQWLEGGIDGHFPTLEDWRYHQTTLFPEVRPKGFLEVRSADAQARAFRAVPLVWWTALIGDDPSTVRVLSELDGTASTLYERWDEAAATGLGTAALAAEAKVVWGTATDAVLRAPRGFFSDEMVRAFLAFGERFTTQGRSPADEAADVFFERSQFDFTTALELDQSWSREVGLPAVAERGAGARSSS